MQFQLIERPRYWWPVSVKVPDPQRPGRFQVQKLKVQFEPLGRDETVAAEEAYRQAEPGKDRNALERAQLLDLVTDWADVVNDAKEPVPFSSEVLTAALQQEWFRKGVYDAYGESQNGQEAARGN